jgi:hypothetical protein
MNRGLYALTAGRLSEDEMLAIRAEAPRLLRGLLVIDSLVRLLFAFGFFGTVGVGEGHRSASVVHRFEPFGAGDHSAKSSTMMAFELIFWNLFSLGNSERPMQGSLVGRERAFLA